jgi:hypothetical protein
MCYSTTGTTSVLVQYGTVVLIILETSVKSRTSDIVHYSKSTHPNKLVCFYVINTTGNHILSNNGGLVPLKVIQLVYTDQIRYGTLASIDISSSCYVVVVVVTVC